MSVILEIRIKNVVYGDEVWRTLTITSDYVPITHPGDDPISEAGHSGTRWGINYLSQSCVYLSLNASGGTRVAEYAILVFNNPNASYSIYDSVTHNTVTRNMERFNTNRTNAAYIKYTNDVPISVESYDINKNWVHEPYVEVTQNPYNIPVTTVWQEYVDILNSIGATVRVNYALPDDQNYTYAKIVYKKDTRPDNEEDGESVTILKDETSIDITDLDVGSNYWFTIFTDKTQSESVPFLIEELT